MPESFKPRFALFSQLLNRLLIQLYNRLYVRVYLAILISLVVAVGLMALAHWMYDPERVGSNIDNLSEVAAQVLPPASAAPREQRAALMRWRARGRANMALYSATREPIASVGRRLPGPPPYLSESARLPGRLLVYAIKLPDGRWLMVQRFAPHNKRSPFTLSTMLLLIAVVVGIAAYPVVRRLTRRLERLQGSVERWGSGQLTTRVAVEGSDEVARLASSFNDAAARIESLVQAQKRLLANASHELRSPLARIRMAVELMQEGAGPALRSELTRNIGELDQLIDEVLLASKLDAGEGAAPLDEAVDFTAIVAEESARAGAEFDALALIVKGDARLLRRMVRNLLENALRHAGGGAVHVRLACGAEGQAVLDVCDRGKGVPAGEREAIFLPFYRLAGASEAAGGVGLGLSLVRQIAQHHQGQVRCIDNHDGIGACFQASLPVVARDVKPA